MFFFSIVKTLPVLFLFSFSSFCKSGEVNSPVHSGSEVVVKKESVEKKDSYDFVDSNYIDGFLILSGLAVAFSFLFPIFYAGLLDLIFSSSILEDYSSLFFGPFLIMLGFVWACVGVSFGVMKSELARQK